MLTRSTLMLAVSLGLGLATAWGAGPEQPSPELGREEVRCDSEGCSLGACKSQRLFSDPAELMGTARIVPNYVDGKAKGFKLFGVRPDGLPAQLGLLNGDIVLGVNGQELTTPDHVLSIFAGLRDATVLTVEIDRRGQPLVRRLRFDRRPTADCPPPPSPPAPPAAPPPSPAPSSPPVAAKSQQAVLRSLAKDISCKATHCTLKHDVISRVLTNVSLLTSGVRIIPVVKDGKVLAIRLAAIAPGSLYALLGLKNGDQIHSINEYDLTSPDKALEAYTKVRQESELRLMLTRNGAPLTLTYTLTP